MTSQDIQEAHIEFLIESVKTYSTQLQLDASNSKVRANHKRCVVVLREIDRDTPLDEIKSIFDKCSAKCLHCEFAGNRSWYLSFKDELEAQVAVQFLKEEVQTFKGESLFARIKTHPIPKANLNSISKAAPPPPQNSAVVFPSQELADPVQIKSPLLSTKSDATTDDDLSTPDLVSPPATAKSSGQFNSSFAPKISKDATATAAAAFNPELSHSNQFGQPQNHRNHHHPQASSHQHQQQQLQSQNLHYHLPAPYPFSQEAYKYYLNSSKCIFLFLELLLFSLVIKLFFY